jgi:hypothetical protein
MLVPFAEMVSRCNAVSTKHQQQIPVHYCSLHAYCCPAPTLAFLLQHENSSCHVAMRLGGSLMVCVVIGYALGQDARCAGFSNLTFGFAPGKTKPGTGHYRPFIDLVGGMDKTDVKWETWTKTTYTPPPAPPPKPPPPPPPPLPRSWQVWKKKLEDGSVAAAFLNRGSENQTITVKLSELGTH